MNDNQKESSVVAEQISEMVRQHRILTDEAETVRDNDRVIIRNMFKNFYGRQLNVGIGFQRAYGSILSGDYFELFILPDGNYLFVFGDISGHGLPAYTTLIRLRSSIILAIKDTELIFRKNGSIDAETLMRDIGTKFTDIMDVSASVDFASVIFTFIRSEGDKYHLRFFSRGMYLPLVVRKFRNTFKDVYDLNETEKGWYPRKGPLLGSELRRIIPERYDIYNSCEFVLYEGDCILYYTDGIIEAHRHGDPDDNYGVDRLKQFMVDHLHLFPQAFINLLYTEVYDFIGDQRFQSDDMTAVLIDFPLVR